MKKIGFLKWLPYLAVMAVVFYALPPILRGTAFEDFAINVIIPACCLGSGIIFGKINGWVWYYCLIVGLMFAPTLVFYYAQSDLHYILEYAFLALMGSAIGYAFHRDKY